MTASDRLALLRRMAELCGQAEVARAIGKSASAVNQVLRGTYQGSSDGILQAVAEVYGVETVLCPVLGEIPLGRCAEERGKPFSMASPQRCALYRACRVCLQTQTPSVQPRPGAPRGTVGGGGSVGSNGPGER